MSLLRLRHNSFEICRFRMRRSCLTSKIGSEIDMRDTIATNYSCDGKHARYWCSCFQIRVYVSSDRKGSLWRQCWHSNAQTHPDGTRRSKPSAVVHQYQFVPLSIAETYCHVGLLAGRVEALCRSPGITPTLTLRESFEPYRFFIYFITGANFEETSSNSRHW